jgi:hypothetical protein
MPVTQHLGSKNRRITSSRPAWAVSKTKGWASTNEYIKKICYLYTMKYHSAIKKNEIMSFAGKWMELEIMSSEIS